MIVKCKQSAPLLVLLQLATLQWSLVCTLSVSTAATKNSLSPAHSRNVNSNNQNSVVNQINSQLSPVQAQLTTLPPLLTTIVRDNNYSDIVNANQLIKQQQQQQQHQSNQEQLNKQRSNSEDHDDTIPLATINNHSRNNQPIARPPQYVDVSALVGVSCLVNRDFLPIL